MLNELLRAEFRALLLSRQRYAIALPGLISQALVYAHFPLSPGLLGRSTGKPRQWMGLFPESLVQQTLSHYLAQELAVGLVSARSEYQHRHVI